MRRRQNGFEVNYRDKEARVVSLSPPPSSSSNGISLFGGKVPIQELLASDVDDAASESSMDAMFGDNWFTGVQCFPAAVVGSDADARRTKKRKKRRKKRESKEPKYRAAVYRRRNDGDDDGSQREHSQRRLDDRRKRRCTRERSKDEQPNKKRQRVDRKRLDDIVEQKKTFRLLNEKMCRRHRANVELEAKRMQGIKASKLCSDHLALAKHHRLARVARSLRQKRGREQGATWSSLSTTTTTVDDHVSPPTLPATNHDDRGKDDVEHDGKEKQSETTTIVVSDDGGDDDFEFDDDNDHPSSSSTLKRVESVATRRVRSREKPKESEPSDKLTADKSWRRDWPMASGDTCASLRTLKDVDAVETMVAPERLPRVFEDVWAALPDDVRSRTDRHAAMRYTIQCSLCDELFRDAISHSACEELLARMVCKRLRGRPSLGPEPLHPLESGVARDRAVLGRYDAYIRSPENVMRRFYRADEHPNLSIWSAENRKRFVEALDIVPRVGPNSNRLIAEHIGNGVHPNHVVHFKQLLSSRERQLRAANESYPLAELVLSLKEDDDKETAGAESEHESCVGGGGGGESGDEQQRVLNELLLACLDHLAANVQLASFRKPAMRALKTAAARKSYRMVVAKAMDLLTMRATAHSCGYASCNEFLRDIDLIVANCRAYCTSRHPRLLAAASELLDHTRELIALVQQKQHLTP
jgi:Bromodomain